jgi:peptidoglycan/xylan/chitin deacetylase (PgdA/CDA1 family)
MTNYLLWKSGAAEYRTEASRASGVKHYMEQVTAGGLSAAEADAISRRLAEDAGLNYDEMLRERMFQIMSEDEVSDLARAGIDIQLHTHRHRTPSDRNLFLREIKENAERIRQLTANEPRQFCYPSGVTSPQFLPWLRECGVESATTCVRGAATGDADPLMLPRYLDGTGSTELDFESWLCGIR